jgi:hypothetical protein
MAPAGLDAKKELKKLNGERDVTALFGDLGSAKSTANYQFGRRVSSRFADIPEVSRNELGAVRVNLAL